MKREKRNMDDVQARTQLKVIGSKDKKHLNGKTKGLKSISPSKKEYDGEKYISCGF